MDGTITIFTDDSTLLVDTSTISQIPFFEALMRFQPTRGMIKLEYSGHLIHKYLSLRTETNELGVEDLCSLLELSSEYCDLNMVSHLIGYIIKLRDTFSLSYLLQFVFSYVDLLTDWHEFVLEYLLGLIATGKVTVNISDQEVANYVIWRLSDDELKLGIIAGMDSIEMNIDHLLRYPGKEIDLLVNAKDKKNILRSLGRSDYMRRKVDGIGLYIDKALSMGLAEQVYPLILRYLQISQVDTGYTVIPIGDFDPSLVKVGGLHGGYKGRYRYDLRYNGLSKWAIALPRTEYFLNSYKDVALDYNGDLRIMSKLKEMIIKVRGDLTKMHSEEYLGTYYKSFLKDRAGGMPKVKDYYGYLTAKMVVGRKGCLDSMILNSQGQGCTLNNRGLSYYNLITFDIYESDRSMIMTCLVASILQMYIEDDKIEE